MTIVRYSIWKVTLALSASLALIWAGTSAVFSGPAGIVGHLNTETAQTLARLFGVALLAAFVVVVVGRIVSRRGAAIWAESGSLYFYRRAGQAIELRKIAAVSSYRLFFRWPLYFAVIQLRLVDGTTVGKICLLLSGTADEAADRIRAVLSSPGGA